MKTKLPSMDPEAAELPFEAEMRHTCYLAADLIEFGRRFRDPANELLIFETAVKILKSARSDAVIEMVILERIRIGFRSIAELVKATRLDRRRIKRLLDGMTADGRLKLEHIQPAGPGGGRPRAIYNLRPSGENYLFDNLAKKNLIAGRQ